MVYLVNIGFFSMPPVMHNRDSEIDIAIFINMILYSIFK